MGGMLDAALVLGLLMLVGVNLAARLTWSSPASGVVICVAVLNGVFCMGLVLKPVLYGGALVLLALLVCPPRPGRRARFHLASVVAVVGGFVATLPAMLRAGAEYDRLRQLYPFEMMADRLPARPPGTPAAQDTAGLAEDESEYDDRLARAGWLFGRSEQLRRLHDEQTRLFLDSVGFGVGRMAIAGRRPDPGVLAAPEPPDRTTSPPLGRMVREDARDFADPLGWGVRRGDRVAGFRPHALRTRPEPAGWVVERVELVGLLLVPDPRVYVSVDLPRMDRVADTPTRHPDGFESPALARLRAGDELVHDGPAGRLLGAVRAARQCLDCHGGQPGDLLGAFSYHLRPR